MEEKVKKANKRVVGFCALALAFLIVFAYLVTMAFKNRDSIKESKQNRDIEHYLDDLNKNS
jgi:CHASE3 domain sensor protein